MYVYQNNKLYLETNDGLVGVNFSSDKIVKLKDTKTSIGQNARFLTYSEVMAKFQITEDNPYVFPQPPKKKPVAKVEKEVENGNTVRGTKGTTTRNKRK